MTDKIATCRHGHELSDDNVYAYLDAKGRTYKKCRTCTLRRLGERRRAEGTLLKVMKKPSPKTARDEALEMIRVNRLSHLQEQLERETRPWLRHDLESEILKLRHGRSS